MKYVLYYLTFFYFNFFYSYYYNVDLCTISKSKPNWCSFTSNDWIVKTPTFPDIPVLYNPQSINDIIKKLKLNFNNINNNIDNILYNILNETVIELVDIDKMVDITFNDIHTDMTSDYEPPQYSSSNSSSSNNNNNNNMNNEERNQAREGNQFENDLVANLHSSSTDNKSNSENSSMYDMLNMNSTLYTLNLIDSIHDSVYTMNEMNIPSKSEYNMQWYINRYI
jgi:hypothetical protein